MVSESLVGEPQDAMSLEPTVFSFILKALLHHCVLYKRPESGLCLYLYCLCYSILCFLLCYLLAPETDLLPQSMIASSCFHLNGEEWGQHAGLQQLKSCHLSQNCLRKTSCSQQRKITVFSGRNTISYVEMNNGRKHHTMKKSNMSLVLTNGKENKETK